MEEHIFTCEIVSTDETLTFGQLCRSCGVDADWIRYLVEEGVLEAHTHTIAGTWYFAADELPRAHTAKRLAHDLGLNAAGIALALELLEENRELKRLIARGATEESLP